MEALCPLLLVSLVSTAVWCWRWRLWAASRACSRLLLCPWTLGILADVGAPPACVQFAAFDNSSGNSIFSSPAIGADGSVYIGSNDYNLYAVDPRNGKAKWTFTAGDQISGVPVIGPDGTIYVGSEDKMLYALHAEDGSVRWKVDAKVPVKASPAVWKDGTVVIGLDAVFAFDGASGAQKWRRDIGGLDYSTPSIDAEGTVYIGSMDNGLHALKVTDGASVWNYTATSWVLNTPAIANGTLYLTTFSGDVIAVA